MKYMFLVLIVGALAFSVGRFESGEAVRPSAMRVWGDVDCSGTVTIVDAQKIARWLIQLPITQVEPCPDIGSQTHHLGF